MTSQDIFLFRLRKGFQLQQLQQHPKTQKLNEKRKETASQPPNQGILKNPLS